MANGLVSVIIPAYRADEYLGAALDSVRRQRHGDWEVIVVEDGQERDRRHRANLRRGDIESPGHLCAARDKRRPGQCPEHRATGAAEHTWLSSTPMTFGWRRIWPLTSRRAERCRGYCLFYLASGRGRNRLTARHSRSECGGSSPVSQWPVRAHLVSPSATVLRRAVVDAVGPFEIAPRFKAVRMSITGCACASGRHVFHARRGLPLLLPQGHAAALTANVTQIQERYLRVLETHFGMATIPLDKQPAGLAINYYLLGRWLPAESPRRAPAGCFFRAWRYDPQALRF